mgnify:FL=1|jgi:hypothetical protein
MVGLLGSIRDPGGHTWYGEPEEFAVATALQDPILDTGPW